MPDLSSLEAQDVRNYWADEAQDFTPWLADEIREEAASELEEALGLDLEVIDEEKRVGRYNLDILAEVISDNRKVVIENQLNPSDHDHLGKSIAYASGVDADIIVWIAPQFHDEHRDAVQWLNQNSREGVDFFAIRLEVWKIGDSDPAVRLNPVDEPSEWRQKAQRTRGELTETQRLHEEFWTEFRDAIEERETPLSARKPPIGHYYTNPIGKSGFELWFTRQIQEEALTAGLIIADDAEAYWELVEDRDEIEAELGEDLIWNEPEETHTGKQRSKIFLEKQVDVTDEDQWEEYIDWMIQTGEEVRSVFHDRIQSL